MLKSKEALLREEILSDSIHNNAFAYLHHYYYGNMWVMFLQLFSILSCISICI